MSRHTLSTVINGKPVAIVIGWDRPAQGYFMYIEISGTNEEEFLYDSDMYYAKNLDEYLDILTRYNVVIPQKMFERLLQDKATNAGNAQWFYRS